MTVELTIAGVACFGLAAGLASVGGAWVLPHLGMLRPPRTRCGSGALTLGVVRFTWHAVTVMLAAFAVLLLAAGWPHVRPRLRLLRWVGCFCVAAAATACRNARRRPVDLLRLPVVSVRLLVGSLSWAVSV